MPNLAGFQAKLQKNISIDLTAKELARTIVQAALETEYGRNFTLSAGFARMVDTLADSIVANPELRRQALSIASHYLNNQNSDDQKDLIKRS